VVDREYFYVFHFQVTLAAWQICSNHLLNVFENAYVVGYFKCPYSLSCVCLKHDFYKKALSISIKLRVFLGTVVYSVSEKNCNPTGFMIK